MGKKSKPIPSRDMRIGSDYQKERTKQRESVYKAISDFITEHDIPRFVFYYDKEKHDRVWFEVSYPVPDAPHKQK